MPGGQVKLFQCSSKRHKELVIIGSFSFKIYLVRQTFLVTGRFLKNLIAGTYWKKKKKVLVRQPPDPFALHFILLLGPQYYPSMVNLAGFIRDSHIINLWSKQHHSRFGCALQTPFSPEN